jgi:hypothetical protein
MTAMVWLGVSALLVVTVALTGIGPKGGKPVARTQLMKTARLILIGGVVVFAIIGFATYGRNR